VHAFVAFPDALKLISASALFRTLASRTTATLKKQKSHETQRLLARVFMTLVRILHRPELRVQAS
jgi:hypothetical protein